MGIKIGFSSIGKFKAVLMLLIIATVALVNLSTVTSAMCPLCVAGAAIGLSVARYYGVDDLVVGLWLGALAVSTAVWINNVINKKTKVKIVPLQGFFVITVLIAATIMPFYFAGFFKGMPNMVDTVFGINRLVVGSLIGGIVTFAGSPVSNVIKKKRGKVFPYQTIILTLLVLVVLSLLFWYVTKYYYIT